MFISVAQTLLLLTGATTLVTAHGNVPIACGNAGNCIAGLGILANGSVPGTGSRTATTAADGTKVLGTESDSTVFNGVNNNGCGATAANGTNKPQTQIAAALAAAGSLGIPQVTSPGTLDFTWHTVVADGELTGMTALLDPTGTCAYANAQKLTFSVMPAAITTSQAQGSAGSATALTALAATTKAKTRRSLFGRASSIFGRANNNLNIDAFQNAQIAIPAGLTASSCTGTSPQAPGVNFCIVKIVNAAGNGNFGGNIVISIVGAGGAAPAGPAPTVTAAAAVAAPPATSPSAAAANQKAAAAPATVTVTVTVTAPAAPASTAANVAAVAPAVYVGNFADPAHH